MQENDFCGLCQGQSLRQSWFMMDFSLAPGACRWSCELRSSRHCGAALLSVNVHMSHLAILLKCRVYLGRAEVGLESLLF